MEEQSSEEKLLLNLASAGNTDHIAKIILLNKGFELTFDNWESEPPGKESCLYWGWQALRWRLLVGGARASLSLKDSR